jgi:hypothetical protein
VNSSAVAPPSIAAGTSRDAEPSVIRNVPNGVTLARKNPASGMVHDGVPPNPADAESRSSPSARTSDTPGSSVRTSRTGGRTDRAMKRRSYCHRPATLACAPDGSTSSSTRSHADLPSAAFASIQRATAARFGARSISTTTTLRCRVDDRTAPAFAAGRLATTRPAGICRSIASNSTAAP